MNKRFLVLIFFFLNLTTQLMAQELPRSLKVGSVNVKYDANAKFIIEKEIQNLNNNRKYLDALVGKMVLHFPVIEKILAESGIPDEIKYLCVQESAFDPDAISNSGAVGFWQFKAQTAKEVGLRVDGTIDERKHLAASTKAAASYLNKSNSSLKNWMSTLLSYRLGVVGSKSQSINEWRNKKEITVTSSTDWYLLRFLAYRFFLDIEYRKVKNNPFNDILFEYSLSRGKSLFDIASELGVSTAEIAYNNRWLKSSSIPNEKDYIVYMPMNSQQVKDFRARSFVPKVDDIRRVQTQDLGFPVLVRLTKSASKSEPIYYEINGKKGILAVEGDTPGSIARRADIHLNKFLKFNDLESNSRIIANEVYYLKKKERHGMVAFHTVQGTETLWTISQMYGIQLEELLIKNRMSQIQRLPKGRLLWLMETRPDTPIELVQSNNDVVRKETKKANPIEPPLKKYIIPSPTKKESEQKSEVTILEKEKEAVPNTTVLSQTENQNVSKEPSLPISEKIKTVLGGNIENENSNSPTTPTTTILTKELKNHIVGEQETYFGISQKYEMKIAELFSLNNIKPGNKLKVGQVLQVYKPISSFAETKSKSKKELKNKNALKTSEIPLITKIESITKVSVEDKDANNIDEKLKVTTRDLPEKVSPEPINPSKAKVITSTIEKNVPEIANSNKAKVQTSTQEEVVRPESEILKSDRAKITTKEETEKTEVVAPENIKVKSLVHIVRAGETLYSISRTRAVTVPELIRWNSLRSNTVEVGQALTLQKPKSSEELIIEPIKDTTIAIKESLKTGSKDYVYHRMKIGETVFRVSQKYGVSVEQIAKWNNLKSFSVSVGQKLIVKK